MNPELVQPVPNHAEEEHFDTPAPARRARTRPETATVRAREEAALRGAALALRGAARRPRSSAVPHKHAHAQLELEFSCGFARGPSERSLLDLSVHRVSEPAGNGLETSVSVEELASRVAAHVADSVRPSDVPTPDRLAALLAWHEERGEVERIGGSWRLTALGRERFSGLLEPAVLEAAA